MGRRLLRGLALLLLGGVGLVSLGLVGGLVFLRSERGNDWLGAQVAGLLSAQMPTGRATLGLLRTDLFHGITLQELALRDASGAPLLAIEHASLRYDLGSLHQRRLPGLRLAVEGATVSLVEGADGQLTLAGLFGPPGPESPDTGPWQGLDAWVGLDEARLEDIDLRYVPAEGEPIVVEGLDLSLRGELSGQRVTVHDLRLGGALVSPLSLRPQLTGSLVFDAGDLHTDGLRLDLDEGARLALSGEVFAVETTPNFALSIDELRAPSALVNRLAGSPSLLVNLGLSGRLEGPLAALSFSGGLDAGTAGRAALELLLRAEETPLGWTAMVDTPGLDVHAIAPGLAKPVHVDGRLAVQGVGTAFPEEVRATFRLEGRDQLLYDEPVSGLIVGGTLEKGIVTLTEASGRHAVGSLQAKGLIDLVKAQADVAAELRLPSLGALGRYGAPPMQGGAAFAGRVVANWSDPDDPEVEADGEIELGGLAVEGVGLASARGPLHLRYAGGAAEARGRMGVTGPFAPDLQARSLDADYTATYRADGGFDGTLGLALEGASLAGDALRIGAIRGDLRGGIGKSGEPWVDGAVAVEAVTFVPTGYTVDGGPLTVGLIDGNLHAEADLSRLNSPFFQGKLRVNLVERQLIVDDLMLGAIPGKPLTARGPARLTLVDGGVRDVQVDLEGALARLRMEGTWLPKAEGATDLHMQVDGLALPEAVELLELFLPIDTPEADRLMLRGVRGLAQVDLHLIKPPGADLQASGSLGVEHLFVPGQLQDLSLDLDLSGPVRRPRFDLRLRTVDGLLSVAQGSIPFDLDAARIDCAMPADLSVLLSPGELARFGRLIPDLTELPVGDVSASVSVEGPACDPDIHVVAAASVAVEPRDERLRIDLNVDRSGGELRVNGYVEQDLERTLALHGTATSHLGEVLAWALAGGPKPDLASSATYVSALDLSLQSVDRGLSLDAVSELLGLPRGISGQLVGGVNLAGPVEAPQLSGAWVWMDGRVGRVVVLPSSLGLSPVQGGYELAGSLDFGGPGDLALGGFVPLSLDLTRPEGPDLSAPGLDLRLSGAGVPLGMLAGIVPGVESASGRLLLSGQVGGTLAAPRPAVQARIEGGALSYADTGLEYRDIQLQLDASAERFDLRRFSAVAEPLFGLTRGTRDGALAMSGGASFQGTTLDQVDLRIVADKLWLTYVNDTQLRVSANPLTVVGTFPNLRVRGSVFLDEGFLNLDEEDFLADSTLQLDPTLRVHRAAKEEERSEAVIAEATDSLLDHIDARLTIDLGRALRLVAAYPVQSWGGAVAAQLSTVELDAELGNAEPLKVEYQGGDISIAGVVEVPRGEMTLMNRSFDVGDGSISFVGRDYEDPILDLAAVRHTGTYGDVTTRITGSVSNTEVKFESEEYPDQTDVLSILLFDKPASELSDTEGQMGANALFAIAGNQLSKLVGSSLRGSQLEFDEGTFKAGAPVPGADKLFLGAEWNPQAAEEEGNTFSMSLEWLITRRLYIEMLTGNAAITSADLYWRWRF